jgi:hypothetical protein
MHSLPTTLGRSDASNGRYLRQADLRHETENFRFGPKPVRQLQLWPPRDRRTSEPACAAACTLARRTTGIDAFTLKSHNNSLALRVQRVHGQRKCANPCPLGSCIEDSRLSDIAPRNFARRGGQSHASSFIDGLRRPRSAPNSSLCGYPKSWDVDHVFMRRRRGLMQQTLTSTPIILPF